MSGETKASEVAPEALPVVTKLITSQREQKGYGQKTVQIIDKAIQAVKKQIEYLEEIRKKERTESN
jgi:phosphopantothenate synthetase